MRAATKEAPLQPARILVVDDEPEVLKVLESLLAENGHRVQVAFSGAEALGVRGQVIGIAGSAEQTLGATIASGRSLLEALPIEIGMLAAPLLEIVSRAEHAGEAGGELMVPDTVPPRTLKVTVRALPAERGGPIRTVVVIEDPAQRGESVVELDVSEQAAAAADLASAIELRSSDVLRSLRVL